MYTIGRFSEICDVPVKTLRYYSDIGLLQPSYIDHETNYRYYDYDKIKIMQKISLLKNYQFSLHTIKELIDTEDQQTWKDAIEQKVEELEKQREEISKQIEGVRNLRKQIVEEIPIVSEPVLSDCYIEEWEERVVYSIRKNINIDKIDQLVKNLFDRIYAFNLESTGHLMATFYNLPSNQKATDVEVLLPIKETNEIEGCKTLCGGTHACLTIKGPYSEINIGYRALKQWITEQNWIQIGNGIEIYEKGLIPTNFNLRDIKPNLSRHPSQFITKICIPVTK